jgi:hypothetical protein
MVGRFQTAEVPMLAIAKFSRSLLLGALVAGAVVLGFSSRASAAECTNDIDCKTHGITCGSDVCDWNKAMTCQPAGGKPAGSDGWCATNEDCKCFAQGARCEAPYCTFTKAPAGSAGSTGSAGATGAAGSTGSAGATGAAGSTGAAGAGGAGPTTSSGGGGCAVAPSSGGSGLVASLFGLGLVATRLARRRRRA